MQNQNLHIKFVIVNDLDLISDIEEMIYSMERVENVEKEGGTRRLGARKL